WRSGSRAHLGQPKVPSLTCGGDHDQLTAVAAPRRLGRYVRCTRPFDASTDAPPHALGVGVVHRWACSTGEVIMAIDQTIDETKLHAFLGQVVGDLAGYSGALMGYIGDRLGLYRAIAEAGSVTSAELAERTGTAERYVRDWLVNQAAGGYLEYDAVTSRYRMPPEQVVALTDESSPAFVGGAFQVMLSIAYSLPRILENVRSGEGMFWGEHHRDLFEGTERFFKPGYIGSLVPAWIPALDGVQAKL